MLQLLNGTLQSSSVLRFGAMVHAGAVADAVGSTVRVPFELMNKQVQTGRAASMAEAFEDSRNETASARWVLVSRFTPGLRPAQAKLFLRHGLGCPSWALHDTNCGISGLFR